MEKVEKTVAEKLFSKNVCSLRGCKKMVNLTKIYSKLVAEKFRKKKKTAWILLALAKELTCLNIGVY